MEKTKNFSLFNSKIDNPLYKKLYMNIKNGIITSKANDYKGIKNIILNLIEQTIPSSSSLNNQTEVDLLFLEVINQLCNENLITNQYIPKLISNKEIKTIIDLDNLFSFGINRTSPIPEFNQKKNVKNSHTQSIPLKYQNEHFAISPNAEEDYKQLLCNNISICEHVKNSTLQILNALSFSNCKIPTSPIKFKHFVHSFIQNQKFMRVVKNVLHLDYEKVLVIITEGIIVDFVKLGIISFPSETKIQYYLQIIELEKYRLTQVANNANE